MSNKPAGGVSEQGEALSTMMDGWDIPPFDPETDGPLLPVQVCDGPLPQDVIDRIKAETANSDGTLWHIFAAQEDGATPTLEQTIRTLLDGQCEAAPELIESPGAEDTYRFALRRLAQMADHKAAIGSMRTELYWTYRMGRRAGYTTGQIKEDCAAMLVKWRDQQPPREAIQ